MPIILNGAGGSGGGGLPAGSISWFAGSGAPAGWLIRDGSLVPVATYPNLFAVIGYTYGGSGANFALPDDRGLAVGGSGLGTAVPGLTSRTLGSVTGSETHTLTVAELATHTHVQDSHNHSQVAHAHTSPAHSHGITDGGHNHTQNAHTHLQNAHLHAINFNSGVQSVDHTHQIAFQFNAIAVNNSNSSFNAGANVAGNNTQLGWRDTSRDWIYSTGGMSSNHVHAISGNTDNTTATNQNTTATNNPSTTGITVNNQTVSIDSIVAVNNATIATNQNTGNSTPHNNMQPTRFYTPIIKF